MGRVARELAEGNVRNEGRHHLIFDFFWSGERSDRVVMMMCFFSANASEYKRENGRFSEKSASARRPQRYRSSARILDSRSHVNAMAEGGQIKERAREESE